VVTTFDPLSAPGDSAELEELRAQCPVAHTPGGPWYLARYGDVLAATQDVDLFQASFRLPGIVVPDEEQLINEIPEPRHGQVRRIINSAIAVHRLVNLEPFCDDLCNALLDDLLSRDEPVELVRDYVMPVPNNVIAHLLGAPREDFHLWAQ
jgi:cytochrome P450